MCAWGCARFRLLVTTLLHGDKSIQSYFGLGVRRGERPVLPPRHVSLVLSSTYAFKPPAWVCAWVCARFCLLATALLQTVKSIQP